MSKPAFLVFGRFNPPTLGHRVMINKMINSARMAGGVPYIVTTHTRNSIKNPLPQRTKAKLLRQMYPGINVIGTSKSRPNPFSILDLLKNKHNKFTLVVGSDRVNGFSRMFSKMNYVNVISGGNRNANSNSANGISATKVRTAMLEDRFNNVRKSMNHRITDDQLEQLINMIKKEITTIKKRKMVHAIP